MNKRHSLSHSLVSAEDSLLVIIDVQEHFLNKLNKKQSKLLTNRISWLIQVAKKLSILIIATAEDIPKLGGISPTISKSLPPGIKTYNKMSFGLTAQKNILNAIKKTKRKTIVLAGMETDVCIAQSALGLLELGFSVVIAEEATTSPKKGHKAGLERIRKAGGLILPLKNLYYEWVRTVKKDNEIMKQLDPPEGLEL